MLPASKLVRASLVELYIIPILYGTERSDSVAESDFL